MEPLCFKVPMQLEDSIRVEYWNLNVFFDPIHYHDECQLTYIINSEGIVFIGNRLVRFAKDELYLIGKNIPHVFKNDDQYYEGSVIKEARAISVFFSSDIFHKVFADLSELNHLNKLLDDSSMGIKLVGVEAKSFESSMKSLLKLNGFDKAMCLFHILNRIFLAKDIEHISPKIHFPLDQEDRTKLNKVFDYTMQHHQEKISLKEISSLINMAPTAFCRYFKLRTLKTYSQFLIEVRISKACKMINERSSNVAEACYSSGYNNISNFHRHFKNVTGMTPSKFKRRFVFSEAIV
jgi:YesN/AraC family two-component response regulator